MEMVAWFITRAIHEDQTIRTKVGVFEFNMHVLMRAGSIQIRMCNTYKFHLKIRTG